MSKVRDYKKNVIAGNYKRQFMQNLRCQANELSGTEKTNLIGIEDVFYFHIMRTDENFICSIFWVRYEIIFIFFACN